ncbi:MAG: ElyC/SanA/YdcF family protein [Thiovulaceae bacterium]|nr:ElyC/SanA/YdcF family protein [Sulfurimonadaceae bacterium]
MDTLFTLKKIISFFVEPFGLVLFFFFVGLYYLYRSRFTKAKIFLSFSFILLFLFSYPPFSNLLVGNLEDVYGKFETIDANISYIHVLGNENNDDTTQPLSSIIGDTSLKRVVEGVLLQKQYPAAKLIFTGYKRDMTLANSDVNAKMALALGTSAKNIIINSKAQDTKEEALFAKSVVGEKQFILVTSATHMLRAVKLFRDNGLNPIPAPTDFKKKNIRSIWIKPDVESFKNSQVAVHEYIGLMWTILAH